MENLNGEKKALSVNRPRRSNLLSCLFLCLCAICSWKFWTSEREVDMEQLLQLVDKVRVPSKTSKIHKEECLYSFETAVLLYSCGGFDSNPGTLCRKQMMDCSFPSHLFCPLANHLRWCIFTSPANHYTYESRKHEFRYIQEQVQCRWMIY